MEYAHVHVVLHPVNDLSSITVKNVNFTSQQDYYCFHVGGEDVFSVAVFEWTSDSFNFKPTTVVKLSTFNQPTTTSTTAEIAAEVSTTNEPSK